MTRGPGGHGHPTGGMSCEGPLQALAGGWNWTQTHRPSGSRAARPAPPHTQLVPPHTRELGEVGLPVLAAVLVVPEVRGLAREWFGAHQLAALSPHGLSWFGRDSKVSWKHATATWRGPCSGHSLFRMPAGNASPPSPFAPRVRVTAAAAETGQVPERVRCTRHTPGPVQCWGRRRVFLTYGQQPH